MRDLFIITAALLAGTVFAMAVKDGAHRAAQINAAAQSWDQENLKRHDSGCPTAIFIAPNGVLEQCP